MLQDARTNSKAVVSNYVVPLFTVLNHSQGSTTLATFIVFSDSFPVAIPDLPV